MIVPPSPYWLLQRNYNQILSIEKRSEKLNSKKIYSVGLFEIKGDFHQITDVWKNNHEKNLINFVWMLWIYNVM